MGVKKVRAGATLALLTAFLAAGLASAVLAAIIGPSRLGNLPAGLSPFGLLGAVAVACFCLAGTVAWTSAGRRMDVSFAREDDALFVVGALTNAQVKQDVHRVSPEASRYLPTRLTLVATAAGLELWGRPGLTRYLNVPWARVESIRPSYARGPTRRFTAVSILMTDSSELAIPITGESITGLSSPSFHQAEELARKLSELKTQVG